MKKFIYTLMITLQTLNALITLSSEQNNTPEGFIAPDKKSVYFPATTSVGTSIHWVLQTPLNPGWYTITLRYTKPLPGSRKLIALDFHSSNNRIASIPFYWSETLSEGGANIAALYIDEEVQKIYLSKNENRDFDSVPVSEISIEPGRPIEGTQFSEVSSLPFLNQVATLPSFIGSGLFRAHSLNNENISLEWFCENGTTFSTPPSKSLTVSLSSPLKQLKLKKEATPRIYLEKIISQSKIIDPKYLSTPFIPLYKEETQKITFTLHGSNLSNDKVFSADFPGGATMAAVFSWDDGVPNDLPTAELFKKYGWRATFFLNHYSKMLANCLELEALGMEIGSHTYNHPAMWMKTAEECYAECYSMRTLLEEKTGHPIIAFAYPFNHSPAYNEKGDYVLEAVRSCGYLNGRSTMRSSSTLDNMGEPLIYKTDGHFKMDPTQIAAAWENAEKANKGIFYIWGHTYELYNKIDWDNLENILKTYGNKKNVWYASQGELGVWKSLRDKVTTSVTGNENKLTVTLERPILHPFYAKRVPFALKFEGDVTKIDCDGADVRVIDGEDKVIEVRW